MHTHTSNQKPLTIINVYSDYVLGVDIVHICLHLNFGTLVYIIRIKYLYFQQSYENKAFEKEVVEFDPNRRRSAFVDVVTELTRTQVQEDVHPFGRGHLYRTALEKDSPHIHKNEGKVIIWVVATFLCVGIAAGVIFMSRKFSFESIFLNPISI